MILLLLQNHAETQREIIAITNLNWLVSAGFLQRPCPTSEAFRGKTSPAPQQPEMVYHAELSLEAMTLDFSRPPGELFNLSGGKLCQGKV